MKERGETLELMIVREPTGTYCVEQRPFGKKAKFSEASVPQLRVPRPEDQFNRDLIAWIVRLSADGISVRIIGPDTE